jgi:hypothetical protein
VSAPRGTKVRDEDLVVGDLVHVLGRWVRITAIRPYTGVLRHILFGLADTVPGTGFSLEIGGRTEITPRRDWPVLPPPRPPELPWDHHTNEEAGAYDPAFR